MPRHSHHLAALALLGALCAAPAAAEPRTFDFSGDKPDAPPAGFTCARTGGGRPGVWKVVADQDGGQRRNVLAQLDGDRVGNRFPVCVRDDVVTADADISVAFKPISGGEDQAAGIVWRYADADNYYIVRANALEDNVVLYKVEKGRRIDLPVVGKGRSYGAKAPVPKQMWSTLAVSVRGNRFSVTLNGARLYEVEDQTFTKPGRIGVWTKADSVTWFADLRIDAR